MIKNGDLPSSPMFNSEGFVSSINVLGDGYIRGATIGLTKREHYAGLALQGILASRELQLAISMDGDSYAAIAVHEADNLLIELEKK